MKKKADGINRIAILLVLLLVTGGWSCNIINPAEPVPSYMVISPFQFTIKDISQGSASNKIEDVWVYVDGNLQGVYELPAAFPVLESGTHSIRCWPGIYFNGIKSQRFPYPFYTSYDTTITLEEGKETAIQPRSFYTAGLAFTNEEFDSQGGIIFDSTSQSLTSVVITTDTAEILEGTGSGKIFMDSTRYKMEIATQSLALPHVGSQRTFVEVNYKTTHLLNIGIYPDLTGTTSKLNLITLKPNTEWNKLYLEITNALLYYGSEASTFKIYFNATLTDPASTGTILLDNFKVINN